MLAISDISVNSPWRNAGVGAGAQIGLNFCFIFTLLTIF